MNKYKVLLKAEKNFGYPNSDVRAHVSIKSKWVGCETLKQAAEFCKKFINDTEIGSGNWAGGEVKEIDTKKIVARVSYNGRIWKPGPYPQPEILKEKDGTLI